MKSKILFALLIAFAFNTVKAQDDPVLIKVAGKTVTKSEFLRVYQKNNNKDLSFDDKSVREYLDLYINYKLKVSAAEDLKMDTVQSFVTELAG